MIASPPGHGTLELQKVAGRTVVTRSQASSPLKLLTPRRRHPAAWVYTSTLGGGMVAGDRTHLDMTLHAGARCVLTTQASSKVYRDPEKKGCRQSLSVEVAEEALVVVAPDPITCYADAIFQQRQDFQLAATSSLVIVDWLTSGRRGSGDRTPGRFLPAGTLSLPGPDGTGRTAGGNGSGGTGRGAGSTPGRARGGVDRGGQPARLGSGLPPGRNLHATGCRPASPEVILARTAAGSCAVGTQMVVRGSTYAPFTA